MLIIEIKQKYKYDEQQQFITPNVFLVPSYMLGSSTKKQKLH